MTHAYLVARAQRWLRMSRRHPVVLAEIGTDGRELPDVIGWKNDGTCTLIECKVTLADFKRDAKKGFRGNVERGLGTFRWYAFPDGFLREHPITLPPGWGAIEFTLSRGFVFEQAKRFPEHNLRGETQILVSAVRRATESWGRKVFGDISPVHGQLDPHPTVAANLKAYRDEIRSLRAKLARERAL